MISFGPTEEQELVRDAMRDFAAQVRPPARARCDEASELPAASSQQAWELGLVATQLPEAFGGGGEAALADHQRARARGARLRRRGARARRAAPARSRSRSPTTAREEQKRELPAALLRQPVRDAASLAWIEPRPCFDPLRSRTSAERKGDRVRALGREVLRRARRSREPLPGARAQRRRRGFAHWRFVVPRGAAGLTISAAREEPRPARAPDGVADARARRGARCDAARRRGAAATCGACSRTRARRARRAGRPLARGARVRDSLRQGPRRLRRGDRAEAGDRVPARRHAHRDRGHALARLEGREPPRARTRRHARSARRPSGTPREKA